MSDEYLEGIMRKTTDDNEPAPQAGQEMITAPSQEGHAAGPADAGSPDLVKWHQDCANHQWSLANLWLGVNAGMSSYYSKSAEKHALTAYRILSLESRLKEAEERAKANQEKYHELLYAVGNKWPGESRHETALRYIRNAEQPTSGVSDASRGAKP